MGVSTSKTIPSRQVQFDLGVGWRLRRRRQLDPYRHIIEEHGFDTAVYMGGWNLSDWVAFQLEAGKYNCKPISNLEMKLLIENWKVMATTCQQFNLPELPCIG